MNKKILKMGQDQSPQTKNPQTSKTQTPILSKSLFDFLYIIGRGGFGKVWKVQYKRTKVNYALKEMSKVKIIDRKSEKSIKNEKDFLSKLHNPFLVNMICSFQDFENLYLVMDLFTGGDLRYHICQKKKFTEQQTKFILACVITGLQYIHNNNIIHRDIKPENLVLDSNGYVAITDFGVAKRNSKDNSTETSGTPGYMAPEVLCGQNHSFPVDFFAVGVIGFEFMNGYRPYLGRNRKEIKESVLSKQAHIHRKDALILGWSVESCDFINKMIFRKPKKRLGFNGVLEVKHHQWFKGFDWDLLEKKKIKSSFIPKNGDNFDRKYCEGVDKIGNTTKERYLYYMRKEQFKDLFFNYTFIKTDIIYNEIKGEKGKSLNSYSNRNTTISSKSSNRNINNFNNFKGSGNNILKKTYNGKSSPNFNYASSGLMKYLENNVNNGNNKNHRENNLNVKYNVNSIQKHQNKYSSLERNGSNSSRRMIYSPPNKIIYHKHLNTKKELSKTMQQNNTSNPKKDLSKTIQQNNTSNNISNKITSPVISHSRPISRMNLNISNVTSSITNYKSIKNNKSINRKSTYQNSKNGINLSNTNLNSNTNNDILKNNYYYHSNNNISNSNNNNNLEIKSVRYNKINEEKKNSNPKAPILLKNESMKFLNFNSSYINNIKNKNNKNETQKIRYSNKRNNRLGSTSHYNLQNNNYINKFINTQRNRPISGRNISYRKNSNHSGLSLIHHNN